MGRFHSGGYAASGAARRLGVVKFSSSKARGCRPGSAASTVLNLAIRPGLFPIGVSRRGTHSHYHAA